ncbi:MAG: hypothetical protein A3H91_17595 [Gammaproteobacteria bacterium RIFCSPLOWO2_02_FULL_61_13]|nr:MAG: hypothetical protein A3H91_17595 [Gammaproteobacteria bacterium RIFCSPLOWO2_02_FULL_61_13]
MLSQHRQGIKICQYRFKFDISLARAKRMLHGDEKVHEYRIKPLPAIAAGDYAGRAITTRAPR